VVRGNCGFVVVGLASILLVGCGSPAEQVTAEGESSVQSFRSWADEIAYERARTIDEFTRRALEDGMISEQGFHEMRTRFESDSAPRG